MENSLELQKWEADVAERRSEGQFFKSLYQVRPRPSSRRSLWWAPRPTPLRMCACAPIRRGTMELLVLESPITMQCWLPSSRETA